jgi:trimeric autotransporter adhesin
MAVPNIFGSATSAIPLSQLDQNFATAITLGNTAVYLGNTTTSLGNVTLTNVLISSTNGDATVNGLTVGRGNASVSTNTAVGASAIAATATATRSTAIGFEALKAMTSGDPNTAVGAYALKTTTTGAANVGVGAYALEDNTTGSNNSALGNEALPNNTTGGQNTAIGSQALNAITTSTANTALGYQAGYSLTGERSVFVGRQAGQAMTTGSFNTIVGDQAGYNATTGTFNTFIGQGSGEAITTGSKNSILGKYSGNSGGLNIITSDNYIVLSDGDGNPWVYHNSSIGLNIRGYDAADTSGINFRNSSTTKYWGIATNSSDFFISNGTFSNYVVLSGQSFTAWTFSSDRRIKTDIVDIEYGLDAVMAMKPRKYKMLSSGETSIGFVAQELKNIVPEAVTGEEIEYLDTDTQQEKAAKTMGVSRDLLIPVLVKAIQELKAEIDALKGTA